MTHAMLQKEKCLQRPALNRPTGRRTPHLTPTGACARFKIARLQRDKRAAAQATPKMRPPSILSGFRTS